MMTSKTPETKWYPVPCPCGRGTIPGNLYEAGKRTCGNEPTVEDTIDYTNAVEIVLAHKATKEGTK